MIRSIEKTDIEGICLACLSAQHVIEHSGNYVCEHCHYEIEIPEYHRLFALAEEAYQLGYVYRKEYEAQFAEHGRVKSLYALNPPEGWMVWITFAVLAGVAGNLAYDVMKAAVIAIYRKHASGRRKAELPADDDREIEIVVEYIREYTHGMPNVPPPIKAALGHELLADHTRDIDHDLLVSCLGDPEKLREIVEPMMKKAMAELRARPLICQEKLPPIGLKFGESETQ